MAKVENFLVHISHSKVDMAREFLVAEGVISFREEREVGGDVTFHIPQTKQNLAVIMKIPREFHKFRAAL